MICPHCGHRSSRVLETRMIGDAVRRYRICRNLKCHQKFGTTERVENWDQDSASYVPVTATTKLAAVPDLPAEPKQVQPKRKQARFTPTRHDQALETAGPRLAELLLQWWNEARRSKHGSGATWTQAAWEASVKRVLAMPVEQALALAAAGVEHGWQSLKQDYLGKAAAPQPIAEGRPMPQDPRMRAALESWQWPDDAA